MSRRDRMLPVPVGDAAVGGLPSPEPSLRGTVIIGLTVIGLFFGALLGWSLFANLDSAVVARGTVVVDSHRKTVQHLEGGILRKLYVAEGDRVTKGQLLAELDSTAADAALGQLQGQYWAIRARIARLRAEQAGSRRLVFPDDVRQHARDPAIRQAVDVQSRLFITRWRAQDGAIEILKKKISQLMEDVAAQQSLYEAARTQHALTERERATVEKLYKKGYERLPRLLDLQRTSAELKGREHSIKGTIAKIRQTMASTRLEIDSTRDQRQADIAKDLQDALALESSLSEQMRTARDVKNRLKIRAPQSGTVVGLKIFTPGGVIAPGQALMDIVPSNDSLVVEARVRPDDIDVVRAGLDAQVWLTAYKRNDVPPVKGRVITVSADQLADPRSGKPYFASRIKVDAASLAHAGNVRLMPGMPAEVMIRTGERRAIDYFIEPLTERMRHAFREQ